LRFKIGIWKASAVSDDRGKEQFDPRSPVQPGRSPVPYLLTAVAIAVVVWTVQQPDIEWPSGKAAREEAPAKRHQEPQAPRGDVRSIFRADDYPVEAQRNGEEGTAVARLEIDDAGRVTGCTIARSSTHKTLDDATCNIVRERAKFVPARNSDGQAVSSTYVTPPVTWRLEG
jgi:protein TonB